MIVKNEVLRGSGAKMVELLRDDVKKRIDIVIAVNFRDTSSRVNIIITLFKL